MDDVAAVGVVPPTRAAAQDLSPQEEPALFVVAVEAGIANGLLIRRHRAADRLGDGASEQAYTAEQDEGARVGGRGKHRSHQCPLGRELDLEDLANAFVDVDLRGAFRRFRKVAQHRRDPFDEESPIGVIGRPVDRSHGLRIDTGEIQHDLVGGFGHLQRELMEPRLGYAVVFDEVLELVRAVGDSRQQFVLKDVAALIQDGLEARFHGFATEAFEQALEAFGAHDAGGYLAVDVGSQ